MVDTVNPQTQQLTRRLASPLSRYKRFTMPKFYPDAAGPAAPAAPAPVAPAPLYQGRLAPTTAQINAGITKFNNAQQRKPGATFNIPKDLYGPVVGPAPVTGLGSFNTRPAATRPRPRPKPAVAATAAAPVAAAPAAAAPAAKPAAAPAAKPAAAPAAKPAAASPWSAGNLWGDAKDLAILGGGALALPAAATGDLLWQGATYALGGDPNTLEGGRWAASEAVRGAMGDAWSRGSDRASAQNASLLRMIGAKPAVDPNQVAAEAGAAQARKRREAMAANTAAAPATAAAAAAAKPAVTAPAANGVSNKGDDRKGNYWIDSAGVRRDITWDANGNLLTGTRNANDPGVRQDRELNRKAILADTQPLYTGKQYNGRDPALMDRYDARQKAALDAVTAQREAAIEQMGGWTVRSNNRDFTVMDPITREEIFTIEVPDANSPSGVREIRVNARGVPIK